MSVPPWESPHLETHGSFHCLTPMAGGRMIWGGTTGWPLCLKGGQFCCMMYLLESRGSGQAACYLRPILAQHLLSPSPASPASLQLAPGEPALSGSRTPRSLSQGCASGTSSLRWCHLFQETPEIMQVAVFPLLWASWSKVRFWDKPQLHSHLGCDT